MIRNQKCIMIRIIRNPQRYHSGSEIQPHTHHAGMALLKISLGVRDPAPHTPRRHGAAKDPVFGSWFHLKGSRIQDLQ